MYDKPNTVFVGGFIGSSAMNFLNGKLEENYFVMGDIKVLVPEEKMKVLRVSILKGEKQSS